MLEYFVEAVFARALEGVAYEGRRPAKEDAADALFGVYLLPSGKVRRVELGIDLAPCLDYIERCDEGMGWTACCEKMLVDGAGWRRRDNDITYDTAEGACGEVRPGVELDLSPRELRLLAGRHGGEGGIGGRKTPSRRRDNWAEAGIRRSIKENFEDLGI